jgi:conjugative relaxase-like TrwC/TraI family protein
MGLSGTVQENEFTTVLHGQDKAGTTLRSNLVRAKVPAYDLTFSAPKSVSVLYGIGSDQVSAAARDAHDEAVRQAIGYLERHAAKVRRGRGGRQLLAADGLTVASFRHRTSRAGDPQLHTHAVVANIGFADGRWSALDSRSLYAHARTAGFLYQAALRDELTRGLGVDWEPVRNGMAEIRGIDPAILRHFSRRRIEIEEHLHQLGRHTRRAAEIAALDTRRSKAHSVPADHLRADWRARAAELGFGRAEIRQLVNRCRPPAPDAVELAATARRLAGPGGVTRNASTFDRRDGLRAWAASHRRGASVAAIERLTDTWLGSPEIIPLQLGRRHRPGSERFTTEAMLQVERDLIEGSRRRRGAGVGVAREQARVVRGLTRSGDRVQVVRAAAGTGKTYALDAAREAWERSDHVVAGCALSARAAVELEQQAGIRSETVARLRNDLCHGYGLAPNSVLIVDEAGMVGTRELADLARHAERANAKLVLVGDDHQLPEIDAGGALAGIAHRIGALELRTVRRQEHDWDRQALTDLRQGRVDE